MPSKKPKKKPQQKPASPEQQAFNPADPDMQYLKAITNAILELKSHVFATQQVMVVMGKNLGVDPQWILSSLKAVQRDQLQKFMSKAEDTNPMLAAWLDTRSLDEIE